MKTSKNLLLTLISFLFFLTFTANTLFANNTISGIVRYSDNNEVVMSGLVKAYSLTGTLLGTASISTNGTYLLTNLPEIQMDIIGLANIEPLDFPVTCYPDQLNPIHAQSIVASGTVTGRDIYVQRLTGGHAAQGTGSISGDILLNAVPLEDALVYLESDGVYRYFGVSMQNGSYSINGIPEGDYILGIHRIGYDCNTIQIHVNSEGIQKVNFQLKPATQNDTKVNPVQQFTLNQNFPNPFNPATVINYNIPAGGNVNLSIYNTAGQLVKELLNEFQSSGSHSVTFNAVNLSSGIYFYKLSAMGSVSTKRMTLVK